MLLFQQCNFQASFWIWETCWRHLHQWYHLLFGRPSCQRIHRLVSEWTRKKRVRIHPFLLLNFALLSRLEIKSYEILMYFWSFLLYFTFSFCNRRYCVAVTLPSKVIKFKHRLKQTCSVYCYTLKGQIIFKVNISKTKPEFPLIITFSSSHNIAQSLLNSHRDESC